MKNEDKQQRRDKWRMIIEEYLQSGMSQKAFSEQRGLSLPQLVYYYGQFRASKATTECASFAPVKLSEQAKAPLTSEIKLSLPNGFQCSFPSHIDAIHIKRLVEVLLSC